MKNSPISTIRERITRLVEKWYILEPLCFLIWTTHEMAANPRIRTVRTGDGRIEYNPSFLGTLSDAELGEVLKAEIIRILLKHPYSRRKENAEAAYLASNITLKEHSGTPLPFPTAVQAFGKKDFERKHFEFYYDRLVEGAASSGSSDGNAGAGGSSGGSPKPEKSPPSAPPNVPPSLENGDGEGENSEDQTSSSGIPDYADASKTGRENTEHWAENDWMSTLVNDKIEVAQQSRSWGTLPGGLQELIVAAMRPRLDYRRILGAFRQSVLASKRRLTRMKPSRRYDFQYMGSRRDFCTKLLFAFDVSGSVPSQDLRRALATLNQFFKYGIESVDVVLFDTALKGEPMAVKKAKKGLKITGRGGTDFNPVMDFLNEKRDYDGAVIFTDGYASVPKGLRYGRTKILWLFNTERCYKDNYKGLKGIGKGAFLK